jgi:hypothetical protein
MKQDANEFGVQEATLVIECCLQRICKMPRTAVSDLSPEDFSEFMELAKLVFTDAQFAKAQACFLTSTKLFGTSLSIV